MKFPAKSGTDFEPVPAGNHVGICNAIIDLGMQPGSGQYPQARHEVYIRFELPTERLTYQKDGREVEGPMTIGRSFTASMSEKANLRKFIESMFGKRFPTDSAAENFDVKELLGRRCLLNVTHTTKGSKTYANISNATPIPKGMVSNEPQHNPSLYFSLESPDQATFDALPEWLRKKIDSRIQADPIQQMQREPAQRAAGQDFDDDIPF